MTWQARARAYQRASKNSRTYGVDIGSTSCGVGDEELIRGLAGLYEGLVGLYEGLVGEYEGLIGVYNGDVGATEVHRLQPGTWWSMHRLAPVSHAIALRWNEVRVMQRETTITKMQWPDEDTAEGRGEMGRPTPTRPNGERFGSLRLSMCNGHDAGLKLKLKGP